MAKGIALTGGIVITKTGPVKNGLLLIKNGKIEYAGKAKKFDRKRYDVEDQTGKYISPGLIDAHTHLGVYAEGKGEMGADGNEMTDPVTPHLRAIDSIDHTDKAFGEALSAGITTVMITPGSANVIGGAVCAAKTCKGTVEDIVIDPNIGQKMAVGENPKRVYGSAKKAPMTRMGIAAVLRCALVDAINYRDKLKKKEKPPRDLRMEALVPIVNGKLPARIHAHRADDILTAVRIAEEFKLKLILEHATEAYKVADILAKKKIPLNIGPSSTGRSKEELNDLVRNNAAICMDAGCMVSLITDHPVIVIADLRTEAMKLVRDYQADRDKVFDAVTINPAKVLGINKRVGSLEKGKDADIAVYTAHPLDPGSVCVKTYVDGKPAYTWDRS